MATLQSIIALFEEGARTPVAPGRREAQQFIVNLPKLTERDVSSPDDTCPICNETFLATIASEELAIAMDSPAVSEEEMGFTKLPVCKHEFCRKCLSQWILEKAKFTCPLCRTQLIEPSGENYLSDEEVERAVAAAIQVSTASGPVEERERLIRARARARANGMPGLDFSEEDASPRIQAPSNSRGRRDYSMYS